MAAPIRHLHVDGPNVFQYQAWYSDDDIALLPGLEESDKYIVDAVVKVSLYLGSTLVIENLALAYIADSDGYYRGVDPANDGILVSKKYKWVLTVTVDGLPKNSSGYITATRDEAADRDR